MDRTETLKILSLVKVAFPNSYNKMSDDELKALTMLWETQFKEFDFEMVAIAVNTFISQDLSGYAPTIAQIKKIAYELTHPKPKTDSEVWEPILKAISKFSYYSSTHEEYDELPSDIKEFVTIAMIRRWAMMDSYELNFVKNEIIKEYHERANRKIEYDLLPTKAKLMIDNKEEVKQIEQM